MQYVPQEQYAQQMQMQSQYMMPQQFHPQQQFNPAQQQYQPPQPSLPPPFTPGQGQSRSPINHAMSRSTSVVSEVHQQQPPATPSPAPPKEGSPSPFVKPKKSSAIKIFNPDTHAEIQLPVKVAAKVPERSASPAVKSVTPFTTPVKSATPRTHTPAPSIDVADEMKAKFQMIQKQLDDEKKANAEKEASEQLVKKLEEERKAKEEAERLEQEKKAEEERKEKERIEKEEVERKAEEERVATQKAKEEEDGRIAKQKAAEEEKALETAKLAKDKEEQKAREEAIAKEAALAKEAELSTPTVPEEDENVPPEAEERRPSFGHRKTAPPPISIHSDATVVHDGQQSAALKTASFIEPDSFLLTKYPDGFASPDPSINAKFGKGVHYNVEFLFQFKDIYKDKPSEDWDTKIKDTMGDLDARNARPMGGPGRSASSAGFAPMGSFERPNKPSPAIARHPSIPSIPPFAGAFPNRSNSRQPSQSGPPSSPGGRQKSRPEREQRGPSRRAPPPPPPSEPPIEPLAPSANRWKPRVQEPALGPPPGAGAESKLAPDVVQRKVKSLLNKLTLEKFDKITDQILEIAGQSKYETDGRTLRQIIALTFEKATDEPTFSEMYATFCRKIMETIDPSITDPAVLNKDGQPLTGGQLFRKYLLNRCQEEFERGWKVNLPPKPDENATGKEAELLSDEYYVAAKAKRQGLGLVQFIGELFKLNMLIEKIMYVSLLMVD
jgi:translation initiation factor 4G